MSLKTIPFVSSFRSLPGIFFAEVSPTPLRHPRLIAVSEECLRDMGWPEFELSPNELTAWLNGTLRVPGEQRIATRYAGHQFGVWAGQLGDGRAMSLGEYVGHDGRRWEIQTKGSGLTPFSRQGDGKAVIRSSVREFMCSEFMNALGIPTTRAMALLTGEDPVERETIERSAIVARVFSSNLRFGHFEYAFHFGKKEALQSLIDYAWKTFYPDCASVAQMLESVMQKTAELVAQWMAVGFCHGVMNTDNMSFLGLTIDYGPYGFMEDTDLSYICNHSDPQGRYSYENQPWIALWNLDRLFLCFTDQVPVGELQRILESFESHYRKSWLRRFRKKLGLREDSPADFELIETLLKVMGEDSLDFTSFFRKLGDKGQTGEVRDSESMARWKQSYAKRLEQESFSADERKESMNAVNPKYILRNYIAQEVIEDVERNSSEKLNQWMRVLQSPFDAHFEFESFSERTPESQKNLIVSCSS